MSDKRASSNPEPDVLADLSQLQEVAPPVLPFFRRLQAIALIAATMWIVAGLLISHQLIHTAQNTFLAEIDANGSSETDYIAQSLIQHFNQAEQLAATLSLQENLITDIVQLNQLSPDLPLLSAQARYELLVANTYAQDANDYLTRLSTALNIPRLYLLNKDGFCVISSQWEDPHACVGGYYQVRDYYRKAISEGSAMQFAVGMQISEPSFFFASAMKHDEAFIGAAIVRLNSNEINRLFERAQGLTVIIDEYGMVVVSSAPDFILKHLGEGFGRAPEADILKRIYDLDSLYTVPLQKKNEVDFALDLWHYNGMDYLLFQVPIANKNLRVVRLFPVSGMNELRRSSWAIAVAVIAFGLMLIIFVERDFNFTAHRKAHLAALASANHTLNKTAHRLYELAISDSLTGLRNHHFFMRRLDEEIIHAHLSKNPLALITMDIDHFKNINDSFGHPVGDEVIRSLADSCTFLVRACDTVGRLGGEEFAIILPNADLPNAIEIAERIKSWCENQRMKINGNEIRFTCSFGVALLMPGWDAKALLGAVDRALYSAKNQGRNCVVTAPECRSV